MSELSEGSQNPEKRCGDCLKSKPLDDFSPASRGVLGRSTYCRECMRVRSKASYRKRAAAHGRTVRDRVIAPDGHKWCIACNEVKPLADFPRNKSAKNGRATYCKPCHNARSRETRNRLYGGGREYHLRRRYGIGQPDVERMLEAQGGKCAGCGKPDPEHVDHDHETGDVRGMLCFNCNQALGNVCDSLEVLGKLQDYLLATMPAQRQAPHIEARLHRHLIDTIWAERLPQAAS